MNTPLRSLDIELAPDDAQRLASLSGPFDAHIRQVELRLGVEIRNRGSRFRLLGPDDGIARAEDVLRRLYAQTESQTLTTENVHLALAEALDAEAKPLDAPRSAPDPGAGDVDSDDAEDEGESVDAAQPAGSEVVIRTRRGIVRGRTARQREYLSAIATNDVNFGIGPAGTGKTYLAVASAVHALERDRVRRIVLTRPAVEAGEKLGFLPGDLSQKVDPYLRPLYDALYEMLGFERVARLIDKQVIEIAPLAFMRGRTLNESYVILDEAQNTTREQMKMFLTRIGFSSVAVVTGDVTQIDLPRNMESGLRHALRVLDGVPGIGMTFFGRADVVRHPLVQAIVQAYEAHEEEGDDRGASPDS
ncbi:PhoH family protein [Algiphilus sp.]|uniref:PhoH family protein n=1 Tax=Algiphilus sp. TaxID=1872431 RepID=UPI001CA63401|nr:PhoH family protein [Algiphilus sp.]MBY8965485.1 PhoH family protein [Algiphilus acroporae]MCI5061958.1 PhoH family protein [Algiphilus sp.]MCI5103529.1 PhoH family protein [Algiphilus sp.]